MDDLELWLIVILLVIFNVLNFWSIRLSRKNIAATNELAGLQSERNTYLESFVDALAEVSVERSAGKGTEKETR